MVTIYIDETAELLINKWGRENPEFIIDTASNSLVCLRNFDIIYIINGIRHHIICYTSTNGTMHFKMVFTDRRTIHFYIDRPTQEKFKRKYLYMQHSTGEREFWKLRQIGDTFLYFNALFFYGDYSAKAEREVIFKNITSKRKKLILTVKEIKGNVCLDVISQSEIK